MTTTLQTSLPLPVLIIGALASIAFFLFLFRQELSGLPAQTRWAIGTLRSVLCVLAWVLIAQPRAVTTQDTNIPVTTKLGVDVSGSMSLTDTEGIHTSSWQESASPNRLQEATALAEAAKIRIQLLKRRLASDPTQRTEEVNKTRQILLSSQEKLRSLESSATQGRLLTTSLESLSQAAAQLEQVNDHDAVRTLERAAGFAAEAAMALRRITAVTPPNLSVASPQPRVSLVNRWMDQASELFERLGAAGEVQLFAFANVMRQAEWGDRLASDNALGEGTNLYGNLNRLAEEADPEGQHLFVLVTDGVDSNPDEHISISAKVQNQPLLVLPVGDLSTAPDVSIESVVTPTRVRENDTFVAQVELEIRNAVAEPITISLLDGSRVLSSRVLQLDGNDKTETITLEWLASGLGPHDLTVEVSTISGEELVANNLRQISCQVTRDTYRVLVCDSKPRWETRYLQNLFKRDASIDMVSLVFEPRHAYPGRNLPPPEALPLALELWQKFDLVILGDVSPKHLTPDHQALLVRYVDGGGNLVLLAGADFMPTAYVGTPLESLVPMTALQNKPLQGSFVMVPANKSADPMIRLVKNDGQSVWRDLYTITPQYRISAWCQAKQTARTLLIAEDQQTGNNYDFMALQRYGRGRILFAAAPCLYHLRSIYGDRYHARVWGQMIRGICVDNFGFEGGLVKTRLDRTVWESGAEVMGRVRLTTPEGLPLPDAEFSAHLMVGDKLLAQMRPIPDPDRPGDYFVRFADTEPGEYIIEYAGEEVEPLLDTDRFTESDAQASTNETNRKFTVVNESFGSESMHRSKPSPFWHQVNQLPLAATVTPQTVELVVDALDLQPERVTRTSTHPLWNVWWFLLAIILVAGSEWLLRRTNGLC